jgi:hypothetical protein
MQDAHCTHIKIWRTLKEGPSVCRPLPVRRTVHTCGVSYRQGCLCVTGNEGTTAVHAGARADCRCHPFNAGQLPQNYSGNPGVNGVSHRDAAKPKLSPCEIRHAYVVCVLQGGVPIHTHPPPCEIRVIYTQRLSYREDRLSKALLLRVGYCQVVISVS